MAEGGGLLNRYRVKSSIGGSNPPLSASSSFKSPPSFQVRECPGILPGMHDVAVSELVDVEFTLELKNGTMRSVVPVPSGHVTLTDLLPILQTFTSGVVGRMASVVAERGQPVSCGPKCGACCRQLVPISNFEAEGLAAWIRSLPLEQQGVLAARFHRALLSLQEQGVLTRLNPQMFELATDAFKELGLEYFTAGVACPFLVEESCSIHPIRPLVCREYVVTSPPEYCAEPGHMRAMGVVLPVSPSRALIQLGKRVEGDAQGWLPLVFLFHWMAAGIEAGKNVAGSGPEVLREFVAALAGDERPMPAHVSAQS